MIIAQEKFKNNIAEYILYMWQTENLIRSFQFDITKIEKEVIAQLGLDTNAFENEKNWYKSLIEKMKEQGLYERGHLSELRDLLAELAYLHQTLLKGLKDPTYGFAYHAARPFIKELHQKQDGLVNDEIEVCLNGLFAFWMLKVSKKPVSADTTRAIAAISKLIALLSAKYNEMMGAVRDLTQ